MQRTVIGRMLAIVATLLTVSLFSIALPLSNALADCCHEDCWSDCYWDDCNSCASSCWDSCCSAAQKCCDGTVHTCHTYVRFDSASEAEQTAFKVFWDGLGMASKSAEITTGQKPMEADDSSLEDFLKLIGEEHVYICSDLDGGGDCGGAIFTVYFDKSGIQPLQIELCGGSSDPCSSWLWGPDPGSSIGTAQPYWRGCQPPNTNSLIYEECDSANPRHAPRSVSDPICKWCTGNSG